MKRVTKTMINLMDMIAYDNKFAAYEAQEELTITERGLFTGLNRLVREGLATYEAKGSAGYWTINAKLTEKGKAAVKKWNEFGVKTLDEVISFIEEWESNYTPAVEECKAVKAAPVAQEVTVEELHNNIDAAAKEEYTEEDIILAIVEGAEDNNTNTVYPICQSMIDAGLAKDHKQALDLLKPMVYSNKIDLYNVRDEGGNISTYLIRV